MFRGANRLGEEEGHGRQVEKPEVRGVSTPGGENDPQEGQCEGGEDGLNPGSSLDQISSAQGDDVPGREESEGEGPARREVGQKM